VQQTLTFLGCAIVSGEGESLMLLDDKAIVRRLYEEVWNKRRLEVVEELISPSHGLNDPIVFGSQMGPELYKRRVVELTTSFPDLRFTIEDMITEKGKVGVSWIISGTHQGEFMDIPAIGSKISMEGITIHHITNGKILDSHARWDALGLVRQLGNVSSAKCLPISRLIGSAVGDRTYGRSLGGPNALLRNFGRMV
jgi:steroid delta-isomerase-like uncharacterized protein